MYISEFVLVIIAFVLAVFLTFLSNEKDMLKNEVKDYKARYNETRYRLTTATSHSDKLYKMMKENTDSLYKVIYAQFDLLKENKIYIPDEIDIISISKTPSGQKYHRIKRFSLPYDDEEINEEIGFIRSASNLYDDY